MTPSVYALLIVADTGRGMDQEIIQTIFDPFFTTKEKGRGTGMGLSVVHGIITGLNGDIQVNSELGKGTQFHIFLPTSRPLPEPISVEGQTQKKIQFGTERILLVEDEEAILQMEKKMLERLGYSVTAHISSAEALETFRANPDGFDLVITDMARPNMPEDKLSTEIIKIHPGIPILLCTGFSATMTEEKAITHGIKSILLKPIGIQDLSQKIRDVLGGKIQS